MSKLSPGQKNNAKMFDRLRKAERRTCRVINTTSWDNNRRIDRINEYHILLDQVATATRLSVAEVLKSTGVMSLAEIKEKSRQQRFPKNVNRMPKDLVDLEERIELEERADQEDQEDLDLIDSDESEVIEEPKKAEKTEKNILKPRKRIGSAEKSRFYATIEEARAAVSLLGIKSMRAYLKLYRQDPKLPGDPIKQYENFSWYTLLSKPKRNFYPTWQDAAAVIKALGINTFSEYLAYLRKPGRDTRLPYSPNKTYQDFPGWMIFFGRSRKLGRRTSRAF